MTNLNSISAATEAKPRFRLPEPPQREMDDLTSLEYFHCLGNNFHLLRYFGKEETTLVVGERWIVKEPGDRSISMRRPDLLISFDVSPEDYRESRGYIISEQGKPPDFILEIASPSTGDIDTGAKRRDYEALGVLEYWRFDHDGKSHGTVLAGDRLRDGVYEPIPIDELPNGNRQGYSPVLNLIIRWNDGALDWIDPATGQHIPTMDSERERRLRAEAHADRAAAHADRVEAQSRESEAQRLEAEDRASRAEARMRELEEELRLLRGGSPGGPE